MEEMKPSTPFLFNLPTEITEEIFSYLTLSDRKKLRLTCKWLYEFCNSDRFCRNEKIIWSEDLIDHVMSDLFPIGRSYYNLVIRIPGKRIEITKILPIFILQMLGPKIRTLDIQNCFFRPGLLGSEFSEVFPHLEDLTIDLGYPKILYESEKWYPCCSNLVSIKLYAFDAFLPPEMIRLLSNARLKYLIVDSDSLFFNEDSFRELVASQLDTIRFSPIHAISGLPMQLLDSPLEANYTVKYLYLRNFEQCPQSTEMLFPKYFRGLVHLTLYSVTDSILQCIFKFQENLRSLEVRQCRFCSISGFCGSEEAGFEYSINNLQKLEHLAITHIRPEVVDSNDFKRAFTFPQLKYLRIHCVGRADEILWRCEGIPTLLYENLPKIQAIRLQDFTMPSPNTLLSLFRRLGHLSYLRYEIFIIPYEMDDINSLTFINNNCRYFSITDEEFQHMYTLARAFNEKKLDRMVIINTSLKRKLYSPKIGAFEIDWIKT